MWDEMILKSPQTKDQIYSHEGPCWLETGTCHLPLQRLNQERLELLSFTTLWKEFRVEIKNKAFYTLGKTGRTGFQIDIFKKICSWTPILASPHPRETLTSQADVLSWCSWLSPLLGPLAAFLFLLIFGTCVSNFLIKFVSSRKQIKLQLMLQGYQLVGTWTTLEQAALSFHGLLSPWDPMKTLSSRKKPEMVSISFPMTCVLITWELDGQLVRHEQSVTGLKTCLTDKKSRGCWVLSLGHKCEAVYQGHGSGAQNQGHLQSWLSPFVPLPKPPWSSPTGFLTSIRQKYPPQCSLYSALTNHLYQPSSRNFLVLFWGIKIGY